MMKQHLSFQYQDEICQKHTIQESSNGNTVRLSNGARMETLIGGYLAHALLVVLSPQITAVRIAAMKIIAPTAQAILHVALKKCRIGGTPTLT